jgi:hypothetical protein
LPHDIPLFTNFIFVTDSFNIFRVITFLPRDVEFVVKFTFLPLLVALISSFVCKLHFMPHVNEYIIYRFAFLPLAISLLAA